jgi:chromosome segregation ATPase
LQRWRTDAGRIEEQESSITDKRAQLECETADASGASTLEEVEAELEKLREEQASAYERVSKINKKLTQANEDITNAQTKVSSPVFSSSQQLFPRRI